MVSYAIVLTYRHNLGHLTAIPGFGWISVVSGFVVTAIPWPLAFLISVVMIDFLAYLAHRLLHTPYLWHTHAAHHSVEHLYWFGGARTSPVHVLVQSMPGAFLGLVLPVAGGMTASVAAVILYVCMQHFNHANIRWRLGPLEWLIVAPRYHFVHHAANPRLNNSNFGFLFTVWDRIFGTYTCPDDVAENFPLGLNYEVGLGRLFIGLPPKSSEGGSMEPRPQHTLYATSRPIQQLDGSYSKNRPLTSK